MKYIITLMMISTICAGVEVDKKLGRSLTVFLDKIKCLEMTEIDDDMRMLKYNNETDVNVGMHEFIKLMMDKYKEDQKFNVSYSTKDPNREVIRDVSMSYRHDEYTEYMVVKIAKIENKPIVIVMDIVRVNRRDLTSR